MMHHIIRLGTAAICLGLVACGKPTPPATLFTLLPSAETHVTFRNDLKEDKETNGYVQASAYMGGGVAVGDLNDDGLDDLYFSSNQQPNKLYLNQGKLRFADATDAAGVASPGSWKTGVTLVDINGDGRLDIYSCRSRIAPGDDSRNQLFINQGNNAAGTPVFQEQAAAYGLADAGLSTQAAFLDFDQDHDLDMVLANYNTTRFTTLDEAFIRKALATPDSTVGIRLYLNEGRGHRFREATQASGIRSSVLTHGLALSTADVNQDHRADIYVSNDFEAPDCLYLRQPSPVVKDVALQSFGHTSMYSMGNDIADVNNDGLVDVFTLDMLPDDYHRQKTLMGEESFELFQMRARSGLNRQYMRNMLHLSNGDGTFSEVGQLSGLSNTDWSWAPLLADYDNDGLKDLFITNGFLHDYTNLDFVKYLGDTLAAHNYVFSKEDLYALAKKVPSSKVDQFAFQNVDGLRFRNQSQAWGLAHSANGNGAAYADLDNDGDLDLIVNNLNGEAFLYRNNSSSLNTTAGYLAVRLQGLGQNTQGLGAQVTVYCQGRQQLQEQLMTRGFQSSVSPVLHFGLGCAPRIDSLRVIWAGGRQQWLRKVPARQVLTLREADAGPAAGPAAPSVGSFAAVSSPLPIVAPENDVNDFKRQPLLLNSLSYSGPCLAQADVNADGRPDLFVGGASGQPGRIFLQSPGGTFAELRQPALAADAASEDAAATFLDAEGDGDQDLYVGSGGYDDFLPSDPRLQDRLYLNDGRGQYRKSAAALPPMLTSTGAVCTADANGDHYPDLFVGGRVVPGRYPESPRSYLLLNDGHGRFTDETAALAPALQQSGMISAAAWADLNGDHTPDLVTAGEWQPVRIWLNQKGHLTDQTTALLPRQDFGWWNTLLLTDLNGDGRPDIVAGNAGLNTQIKASSREPAELFYKDFDDNGAVDPILCVYNHGKSYPFVTRDELLDQISMLRPRFPNYRSFADATLTGIFTQPELAGVARLQANCLRTQCYLSAPGGKYRVGALPEEAQLSPVFAVQALDYNHDGHPDLVLGGNTSHTRIRFGDNDANFGCLLAGDGHGGFRYVPQRRAGLSIHGDVRSFAWLNHTLLVGRSGQSMQAYQLTGK